MRAGQQAVAQRFSGFDDGFFDQRRQAYLDFARPQLDQQFSDATRELAFALERQGLGNSSVAAARRARLQATRDARAQEIAGEAEAQVGRARSAVADARRGALDLVTATGDADAAVNDATARATALSTMPTYSPLGDAFANAAEGLVAFQGGALQRELYGPGARERLTARGSSRVVR